VWQARRQKDVADILILLEHTPVVTFGRGGGLEDLHLEADRLREMGVDVYETNRGGRATFHGPGQMVAYPIMELQDRDLHGYLWKLEETIIRVLDHWGIQAQREERYPGVWIGKDKIAAIGVAVRSEITQHGLALNVNTDLSFFNLITPCGIKDRGVTSMEKVLGYRVPMNEVRDCFIEMFGNVFHRKVMRKNGAYRS
jgi:lipoate-protein ligase B